MSDSEGITNSLEQSQSNETVLTANETLDNAAGTASAGTWFASPLRRSARIARRNARNAAATSPTGEQVSRFRQSSQYRISMHPNTGARRGRHAQPQQSSAPGEIRTSSRHRSDLTPESNGQGLSPPLGSTHNQVPECQAFEDWRASARLGVAPSPDPYSRGMPTSLRQSEYSQEPSTQPRETFSFADHLRAEGRGTAPTSEYNAIRSASQEDQPSLRPHVHGQMEENTVPSMRLTINPNLEDFERRIANGTSMLMHIEYLLQILIPRYEEAVRRALLPQNTAFRETLTITSFVDVLHVLGPYHALEPTPLVEYSLFPFQLQRLVDGEDADHRHRCARDLYAQSNFVRQSFRLIAELMKQTLLPENTPWTLSFTAEQDDRRYAWICQYGGLVRVGRLQGEAVNAHAETLSDFENIVVDPDWMPSILEEAWEELNDVLWEHDRRRIEDYLLLHARIQPESEGDEGLEYEVADAPDPTPASSAAIDALPVKSYDELKHLEKVSGSECAVCRGELEGEIPIVELPCGHFFHEGCVKQWLSTQNKTCPSCRASIENVEED